MLTLAKNRYDYREPMATLTWKKFLATLKAGLSRHCLGTRILLARWVWRFLGSARMNPCIFDRGGSLLLPRKSMLARRIAEIDYPTKGKS
jgi:hypothetical protein